MVAVQIAETGTFATFVYHFRERRMYAPVLFNPGTEEELAMMEAAKINRL